MNKDFRTPLAVIVLNWNGRHLLNEFLPTLMRETPKKKATIIVADNNSIDGSVEWIKENFPEVVLYSFEKNYGFAEGYNKAIQLSDYRYICLLNSDVQVTKNWIEGPMSLLESPHIAAVQPKIKSYKHPSYFEYAGAAGGYIDKYGYPFCRGRLFSEIEEDKGQYNISTPISWASGACLFIKRDTYIECGGLDPFFFAHQEEIDLCWRIYRSGKSVYYCPDSEVYHVGGATLATINPQKVYLNYRNNYLMLYKNLPAHISRRILLIRLFLDIISVLLFLLQRKKSHAKAILEARKDYKKMREHYKPSPQEVKSHLKRYCVVYQYFILRHKKYFQLPN